MKKILLGILLVVFAISCGSKPETVVSKFIDNVKAKNMEEATKYIADKRAAEAMKFLEYNNDEQKLFFETLFKNMKYKIVKTEKSDENTTIVTTEIENVDIEGVFVKVFQKRVKDSFSTNGSSQVSLEEDFKNILESKDAPLTKNTTQFAVVKTKEGSKINIRLENLDVMLGKFLTALQNLDKLEEKAGTTEKTEENPTENTENSNDEKKEAPKAEQKQKLNEPK